MERQPGVHGDDDRIQTAALTKPNLEPEPAYFQRPNFFYDLPQNSMFSHSCIFGDPYEEN